MAGCRLKESNFNALQIEFNVLADLLDKLSVKSSMNRVYYFLDDSCDRKGGNSDGGEGTARR